MKTTFALTVFEILLLEARLVLEPVQRVTGTERVNISVKTKINVPLLLEMFLVFSSIIIEVIRPVLNFFFFFFYDKISQVQKGIFLSISP